MIEQLGKMKRLYSILGQENKALIVPVDDLLISGPQYQLAEYETKIKMLANPLIDAVLGFPGVFRQFYSELKEKAWIINLTTSTVLNEHTKKVQALELETAVSYGCDAVAVHVNMSSKYESNMVRNLGMVSGQCDRLGIPLIAIMYVRKEKGDKDDNYECLRGDDNQAYTRLVSHAVRVAVELGADIIKTNYTGSMQSFREVIKSAGGVPVILAGGKKISEEETKLQIRNAMQAGASGICFGRNLFYRDSIPDFITSIKEVMNNE